MIQRIEDLYSQTLRKLPIVHRISRHLVYRVGGAAVTFSSRLRNLKLPPDELLPIYSLRMLWGLHEREITSVCRRYIRPGMNVVDVGAHAGYFTILFSDLVGSSGEVVAFEPDPTNFECLMENVRRRRLKNVKLFQRALGGQSGRSRFYRSRLSMSHSLLPIKDYSSQNEVDVVTLDQVVAELDIQAIDLVKIDVEGSEPEVIAGLKGQTLRQDKLALIVEYKPDLLARRGVDGKQLILDLEELGFVVCGIRGGGQLFPFEGDIRHSTLKRNLMALKPADMAADLMRGSD